MSMTEIGPNPGNRPGAGSESGRDVVAVGRDGSVPKALGEGLGGICLE